MAGVVVTVLFLSTLLSLANADTGLILKDLRVRKDLEHLLIDLINELLIKEDVTCLAVVCDSVYLNIFEGILFKEIFTVPYIMIVVEEYEDLLSPNFDTLESLRQARNTGCSLYVIILANGLQVSRLLKFGDRYRLLDTRAKYIMLHDIRLFRSSLYYIWKRIVNVIFLKYHTKITGNVKSKAWFELSTVPFPNPVKEIFIPRRVDIWRNEKFHYGRDLFTDKAGNLYGEVLNVVYLGHVPSVVVTALNTTNLGGVEIEILKTLAQKMNFEPKLYQSINAEAHKWGQKQANGSFSGLLGEMVTGKADMALGNLQYTPYHLELTDLSIPYTSQCWTFLTPEALTDNSWKTLILPFKLNMWIAVLLVLLVTGAIFYGLALYYMNLLDYKESNRTDKRKDKFIDAKPVGLYLFSEITNSILYTYGMLLVVSLPKFTSGWSIRLLTGWYWLYCILLVVSYRASMTAILANPSSRVTIDTLKELVDSKIACGGWGSETKTFFEESLDEMGQILGERFENVDDPDQAAIRIGQGTFAYYDSEHFLKYLSVKRKNSNIHMEVNSITNLSANINMGERNLHIMSDCVVNIPISIGFHINSPLKPLADVYMRRIVEVGLVEKWLNDAMHKIRTLDRSEEEGFSVPRRLQVVHDNIFFILFEGLFEAAGIGNARNDNDANCTYEGENSLLLQQSSNWLLNMWPRRSEITAADSPLSSLEFLENADENLKKTCPWEGEDLIDPYNLTVMYKWLTAYMLKVTYEKVSDLKKNGKDNWQAKNDSQSYYAALLSVVYGENYIVNHFYKTARAFEDEACRKVLLQLVSLYAAYNLEKHMGTLYIGGFFQRQQGVQLRAGVLRLCAVLAPHAVSLVDTLAPPDHCLHSVLASADGEAYKNLQNKVMSYPGALTRPHWWRDVVFWKSYIPSKL